MLLQNKQENVTIVTVIIILLISKILLNPSPRIVHGLSSFICPQARYFFQTKRPSITLNIDDSPHDNHQFPHTTLQTLDVLAQYQAQATFFVITNKA